MNSFLWEIRYRPDVRINSITILLRNLTITHITEDYRLMLRHNEVAVIHFGDCFYSGSAVLIFIF